MDLRKALAGGDAEAFRERLIDTLKRCEFCVSSVERYRTFHGVYDYGPLGCSMKSNVLELWHRHFVLEEQLSEVCCPYDKAERHADDKIIDYSVTVPDTKYPLCDPYPLKLMFQTPIGESGFRPGKYMRPEAARPGRNFDNFKFLFEYNNSKLPCAGAYIGLACREEISPSLDALIVHEFTVAGIQHFVDPEDKTHRKFPKIAEVEIFVFPRERQMLGQSSIKSCLGVAVSEGTIDNETLGYFIGRVFLFLTCLGIDKDHLRFRQRVEGEMSCHATDCWVAEVECSSGWIECVDITDWSSYDLSKHTGKSGVALLDNEKLTEAGEVEKSGVALLDNGQLIETRGEMKLETNVEELGHAFDGDEKIVVESLLAMSEVEASRMKASLEGKGEAAFHVCKLGKTVIIKNNMVNFFKKRTRDQKRVFTPYVVEPSFGVERIMHCLFEHFFYTRPGKAGDEQVNVFHFPPLVAPIKCAVFRLRNKPEYNSVVQRISISLTAAGVFHRDYTAGDTLGKMYVKTDELGVPYAIFVDSKDDVTIRERDSKDQVQVSVGEAATAVKRMINGQWTWSFMWSIFPHCTSVSAEDDELSSY